MPNKKKYYINTFTFTVLSESSIIGTGIGLENLWREVNEGALVLANNKAHEKTVSGRKMAKLLYAAGSEPGFFNLNDEGNSADK